MYAIPRRLSIWLHPITRSMNAPATKASSLLEMGKETVQDWIADNAMRLSAALAYYSIFSAAPLLLVIVGIVGWVYGPEAADGKVAGQISSVVGSNVAEAIQGLAANAKDTGKGATFIGLATLLVGASGVFGQLKDALNTIWEVRQKKGGGIMGFLRQRVLTFGMVLSIGFLLMISLVVATVVTKFGGVLESQFGIPHIVSQLVGFLLPLLVETLLFAMMYKFLPDAKIPWSSVWVGAAATAVLFEIGKFAFTLYLSTTGSTTSYGAAGSAVLLLLWVYYSSMILFLGAEFTEVYSRRMGHEIVPGKHGEAVRTCERAEEGMEPKGANQSSPRGTGVAAVKAELHPLSDNDEKVPSWPVKESVATFMEPVRTSFLPPPRARYQAPESPTQDLMRYAREHPFAELGAAVGAGLVLGLVSRFMERRPALDAGEHFRRGAKVAAAAGAAAFADASPRFKKAMSAKELKKAARAMKAKVGG